MKAFFVTWIFASVLAIFDAGFVSEFKYFGEVNLLIVFTLIAASMLELRQVLIVAIISGVMLDFYSGLIDGVLTGALIISALAVYLLSKVWLSPTSEKYIVLVSAVAGTVVFNLSVVVLSLIIRLIGLDQDLSLSQIFLEKIWMSGLFAALLAYPMLFACDLWKKLIEKPILK